MNKIEKVLTGIVIIGFFISSVANTVRYISERAITKCEVYVCGNEAYIYYNGKIFVHEASQVNDLNEIRLDLQSK